MKSHHLLDVESISVPRNMLAWLRSDHAGETGAVWIYKGIQAVTCDHSLKKFADHHLATEQRHLELMQRIVASAERSRLLPLWRVAGWLTGALPAAFGAAAVYRTIDAVETFVDQHYLRQIEALRTQPQHDQLRVLLESCRADEIEHRNEARSRLEDPGVFGRIWAGMVASGSRAGVYLASRL